MIKSLTTRKGQVIYYDNETKEIIKPPSIACYLAFRKFMKRIKGGNKR